MASYNELNALIDAYINRNGVQAITGQILNGVLKAMVEQLGRGYTIMGAATPTTDPGTPDGPECYFASETGTYTDFDGLQVVPGELALLCYTPTDGWMKNTIYEGFQTVNATIDGNVGTPSVGVSYANGVLSFDFHNMKGNPGDAAGFGTIGADIAGGVGTPGVSVESSGPATAKNLQFHFTNLKGETGVTSVVATVDNTSGTPSCAVSLQGQQLTLAFTGLKGAQGDTGSSVDYPFTIVNNLTTDDATQALSAAQGVVLDGKVTQLEAELNGIAFINSQSFSGDSNPSFSFDEVAIATPAVLKITGTTSAIAYCVFYHDSTNVGLLDLPRYTNVAVTVPATANSFRVFRNSGQSLDIVVSLTKRGMDSKLNDLEDEFSTLSEGAEYRAGTIDESIVTNATDSTASVWFQKTPRLMHIDKIRFLAKTGTTYFYTVNTNTSPATITQIKEIVTSQGEENLVKDFDVNLDLADGVYIGFNGAIRYAASSIAGYKGAYCNPDGTGMSAEADFVCGFEVASKIKSAVTKNGESIVSLDARVTELEDGMVTTETIGADPAGNFPQSANNTTYIWAIKTPSVSGKAVKINFKAKQGTVNFYKVHAENIATGQPSTITQIGNRVNTSAEEGTVQSVDINATFGADDYLGVNGAFYYESGIDSDYLCFIVIAATGVLDSYGGNAMKAGLNIVVESSMKNRTIPNNIVFVDSKGHGDYLNPFDAMVALLGKDTATNPYTIMVAPGVYNMPTLPKDKYFTYCTNRFLAIIGTDKQNCILRNDKGYYNAVGSDPNNLGDNSPLKISGNIYIANLTIISTDTENASESAEEYHLSYCIHIDAGATEGSIMEIHNCRLVNNHAPCIGFGIPKNVTLKITDSDLKSNFYNPNLSYGGAIVYGHDRDGSTSAVQEHLVIRNCILKSSNGHAVKFVNNNNALADCVFIGNACDLPSGKSIVLGSTTTVVAPSFGNNLPEMNA